ncbi:putative lipoate-protein ligase B [Magnetofaba australis IT-1]|uniref:Octanoyltransferase n=1 Tax=Magnetofaba australis IT-1 TaxID=1434232 RepID=A0A1Y2K2Y3_9PROT|nr:putative lipoate-protein ligase B [Magnetofaba australis IT-1]
MLRRPGWDYLAAWDAQKRWVDEIIAGQRGDTVILTDHPPVYTVGRNGSETDVLRRVQEDGTRIPIIPTDRGGQVTYHGPGQLVAYVLCNLAPNGFEVKGHVARLEQTLLTLLGDLGLTPRRDEYGPGIWVGDAKIGALGVRIKRGVTYHGLSLNHDPALAHFAGIVPCGQMGGQVTSLRKEGVELERAALERRFLQAFKEAFQTDLDEPAPE